MGTNNVKLKKYPKTIRKLTENDFALIKEDITNQLENLSKYILGSIFTLPASFIFISSSSKFSISSFYNVFTI